MSPRFRQPVQEPVLLNCPAVNDARAPASLALGTPGQKGPRSRKQKWAGVGAELNDPCSLAARLALRDRPKPDPEEAIV
jgi:hypothetical protein